MAAMSTLVLQGTRHAEALAALVQDGKSFAKLKQLLGKRTRIITISLVTTLCLAIVQRQRRLREKAEESRKGKEPHRRNSAVALRDGTYEIWVPSKSGLRPVIINPTRSVVFDAHHRLFLDSRQATLDNKVRIDKRFLKQFLALWAIIVPRFTCKEVGLLTLHFFFLVTRTWLSLMVARIDGRIVKDLVAANGEGFLKGIGLWLLIAVPASYTNAVVSISECMTVC